jgi:hypothetical protein
MKHFADNRGLQDVSVLQHFVRIDRQKRDRLLEAAILHPQRREDSNARVVAFCRIERGELA